VRHVGAEAPAHDAVPAAVVVAVELLADEVGYSGVHVSGGDGQSEGGAGCAVGWLVGRVGFQFRLVGLFVFVGGG